MPHLYDKLPPGFAKDPFAWDYTRDRIEQNTGVPYDQWEGKHFAGSAAMYKNVVKKYGNSMQQGDLTMPKECVDCNGIVAHYVDDYICRDCRDAIENAGSYQEAEATISNPGSIDAIREQLYRDLGHDKKDKAKGRPVGAKLIPAVATPDESNKVGSQEFEEAGESAFRVLTAPQVSRNYKAMSGPKLARCIEELDAGQGDAVKRAVAKGEAIDDHLEAALRAQQEAAV
jgi:hypothetical protein